MKYSEVALKYIENLTDYNRRQIIEMIQGKGNYTKYNRDKVITLYRECSMYPSKSVKETTGKIPKALLEQARENLMGKVSLRQLSEEFGLSISSLSYFTRLKLDELNYPLCEKIDKCLKESYNFDLLKECDLPQDYFKEYFLQKKIPIQEIADKLHITYVYVLRVINKTKHDPTYSPKTFNSQELVKSIRIEAKKRGLL